MTAPAAPRIRAHFDGNKCRVLWQAVDTATDYTLYVGIATAPSGVEAQFDELDMGTDGWFHYTFLPDETPVFVAVTASNELAEESDRSNEKFFVIQ